MYKTAFRRCYKASTSGGLRLPDPETGFAPGLPPDRLFSTVSCDVKLWKLFKLLPGQRHKARFTVTDYSTAMSVRYTCKCIHHYTVHKTYSVSIITANYVQNSVSRAIECVSFCGTSSPRLATGAAGGLLSPDPQRLTPRKNCYQIQHWSQIANKRAAA